MKKLLIVISFFSVAISVLGQADEKDIIGKWVAEEGESKLEFYERGNCIYGKVIWLKKPKDDVKVGDIVVTNLKYNIKQGLFEDGEFRWGEHKLDCEIKLFNKNRLQLKMSRFLFTRDVIWTRIN